MIYWCLLICSVFEFVCFCKFFISITVSVLIVVYMYFSDFLRVISFMRSEPWVGFIHELRLIVMSCWRLYSWHDNVYMILSPNASLILRENSVLNQDNRDEGQSAETATLSAGFTRLHSEPGNNNLQALWLASRSGVILVFMCSLWSTCLNRCQCCLKLGLTYMRSGTSCTVHSDINFLLPVV